MRFCYFDYVLCAGRHPFEVEHVWAKKPERHTDEFLDARDFEDYRNRIGGLLLSSAKLQWELWCSGL